MPAAPDTHAIDERIDAIARHPFRAKFHLRARERAKARELTPDEQAYVVDVICRWVEREVDAAPWRKSPA